jgi:membrane dipeptidase
MGMNMSSHFLNSTKHADVNDIVRHINYIRDLAGIDVIGLGTDFDGIESGGLKDASEMPLLKEALKKEGYSQEEIDKIFYKNVLRVYEEVL